MAYPSVTYTFTNATTASATEVNQNFTDLINGMSDGTKDFSINALTVAGTATLNGAVNLGNATGDDITVNGYVASDVIPKTDNTYDLGTSALAWKNGYFDGVVYTDTITELTASAGVTIEGINLIDSAIKGGLNVNTTGSDTAFNVNGSTGEITIGVTPSASNASQAYVGGSAGATYIFRNSAADANGVLILSRAGTNNGSETYMSFHDGATSANPGSAGTSRYILRVNSGNTAMEFASSSDERLKNISGIYSGGLNKVLSIPIKQYAWKQSPDRQTFGVIAQDVARILPECSLENEDGTLSVSGFNTPIFVMWNAIQEQQAMIEALQAEVAALKAG